MRAPMYFLVINAGSSSIRFGVFDAQSLARIYAGKLSGIGFESAAFGVTRYRSGQQPDDQHYAIQGAVADHHTAIRVIYDWLGQAMPQGQVAAIGHRVVHGGPALTESCLIDDRVISSLRDIEPLDPEHLPVQTAIIAHAVESFPQTPQIACFDTTFFHDLPTRSRVLPLPRRLEAEGIRRYGFHGLSYSYVLGEFERVAGRDAAQGRVIIAHLGNGASLTALTDGKPIDTSMGLTPAGGIPMSSRSGDLDPGVLAYLARRHGLDAGQLEHMVGFESGLLGISGISADMKQLLDIEADEPQAHDAVEIFCYGVRKCIGAYAAALGGLDSLVFSGGIGEVSAPVRSRICQDLGFLGITLDDERNQADAECISATGAAVGVHVLATDEAATIAREMQRLTQEPK